MARILVIDDDSRIRELLRQILEEAGYTVDEAPDGQVGIEMYAANPVDVVLLDIIMPEKEGIETIRELKSEFPDSRVIAISGGGRIRADNYLKVIRAFGAEYTFAKPVPRRELLDAISSLCEDKTKQRSMS
jgi:DNA-binding response OmpR family regulator